jgi:drug/metabolite transporter (DMT)-like permease
VSTPAVREDRVTLLAFGALVVLVGANLVATRFSNRELAPFWGAGIRFAVAAVVFAGLVVARGHALPRGRAFAGALLYGLFGIGAFFSFVYLGLRHVGAGLGGVVFALIPMWTLFLAVAQRLERFRWRALAGAVVAAAGVGLVFRQQVGAHVPISSLVYLLAADACIAEAGIVVKRLPPTDPVATNAVAMTVGTMVLLSLALITGEHLGVPVHGATWTALAYLASLGTVAVFLLFLFLLKRWRASSVSYQFVLAPFVSIGLGVWLLSESVKPITAVGAAMVLVGVYVGALAPGGKPSKPVPGGLAAELERRPPSLVPGGDLCGPSGGNANVTIRRSAFILGGKE